MSLRVAVLMGGPSEEREISLSTGSAVVKACKSNGFETVEFSFHHDIESLRDALQEVDVVFNALHGGIGENGEIQAWMDQNEIKYTGSGSKASALCMDKAKSKEIARRLGMRTPDWELLASSRDKPCLALPFVVKPNDQGSTVGLSVVREISEIEPAIHEAFNHGHTALTETYIHGRELTVTILGNKGYPIVEIKPSHELYDYECKYTPGLSHYVCPAEIPDELAENIQKDTETIFRELDCSVYGRADYLLDENGQYYFLEVNTLPGMTATSLVPKSVNAAGMSFEKLIKSIIDLSL